MILNTCDYKELDEVVEKLLVEIGLTAEMIIECTNKEFIDNMYFVTKTSSLKKLDIVFTATKGDFSKIKIYKDSTLPHYMKSFLSLKSFFDNMDRYMVHQEFINNTLLYEIFEFDTGNKMILFTKIL